MLQKTRAMAHPTPIPGAKQHLAPETSNISERGSAVKQHDIDHRPRRLWRLAHKISSGHAFTTASVRRMFAPRNPLPRILDLTVANVYDANLANARTVGIGGFDIDCIERQHFGISPPPT